MVELPEVPMRYCIRILFGLLIMCLVTSMILHVNIMTIQSSRINIVGEMSSNTSNIFPINNLSDPHQSFSIRTSLCKEMSNFSFVLEMNIDQLLLLGLSWEIKSKKENKLLRFPK